MSTVNVSDVRTFCKFYTQYLPTETFTWAFLDSESNGVIKGFGTLVADIDYMLSKYNEQCLLGLNKSIPTVHVTLNQTNDNGRKNSDIIACRVFCVDLDYTVDATVIAEWIMQYDIGMVVESSPGKFHLYWQCDPSIRFEEWVNVQTALAGYFEGDLNLRSLCKTIRVPGFSRVTKDGEVFMPHIVHLAEQSSEAALPRPAFLNDELMRKCLETAGQRMADDKREQKKISKEIKKKLKTRETPKAILTEATTNNEAGTSPAIGRNTTLYHLVKEYVYTLDPDTTYSVSEDAALSYGYQVNAEFETPLENSEVEQTVRSAYCAALAMIERREASIEEAKDKIAGCLLEPLQGLDSAYEIGRSAFDSDFNGVTTMDNGVLTNGHYPDSFTEPVSVLQGLGITESVSQRLEEFAYNLKHKAIASSHFSDYAIAERVLQRYHSFILRCDDNLMAFNPLNKLWKDQTADRADEIKHFCKEVLIETVNNPDIVYACLTKDGEVSEDKLQKFKDRLLSAGMLRSIASLVASSLTHPSFPKSIFDSVSHYFFCANGVLDLLTGAVREAEPTDYLLARSTVEYRPEATCDGWTQFLLEVFANNEAPETMVSMLQEVFGYTLGGSIQEQKVFIHLGGGSNGKSKILTALTQLTGDYATYMPPDELTKGKSFGKAFEEFGAKLEGVRVGIIDDLDTEGVWNEAFIKNITSPRVRARGKFERSREFANRAKVHLGLNNAPKASAESHGLLRRLFIIPYNRRFEPIASVSEAIDTMIAAELPGILNWAIEGYRRWAANGLSVSDEVTAAVNDYKEDNFHQENLVRDLIHPLDASEQSAESGEFVHDIFARYTTECSVRGEKPTFTQIKLVKYISEMYNLRPKKSWCAEKRNTINKLQIKFKAI